TLPAPSNTPNAPTIPVARRSRSKVSPQWRAPSTTSPRRHGWSAPRLRSGAARDVQPVWRLRPARARSPSHLVPPDPLTCNTMVTRRETLAAAFGALGDPVRIGVLQRLAQGPATAGQLARLFDVSRPAVSRHVRVLRDAGLVGATAHGRHLWYVA